MDYNNYLKIKRMTKLVIPFTRIGYGILALSFATGAYAVYDGYNPRILRYSYGEGALGLSLIIAGKIL
jgi:hypothetical protein